MSNYAKPIDVTTSAELNHLAEQVQRTHQPIPLTRDNQIVAVVQPAPVRKRTNREKPAPARAPSYPTLESLAGAAGCLPEPRLFEEVLEEAREDHLARKFPRSSSCPAFESRPAAPSLERCVSSAPRQGSTSEMP